MKLVTYLQEARQLVGVLDESENWVYPVFAAGNSAADMLELICSTDEAGFAALRALSKQSPETVSGAAAMEDMKLLAPIPMPRQDIVCLGVNYADHAEESARFHRDHFLKDSSRQTIYFSKRVNRAVDPFGGICAHEDMTEQVDYEAELAVILKKDAKDISREEVKDYIFGYTIMNDVSARDVQTAHKQFYFGKSLDDFTPLGPCIVTADEISYPPELRIRSFVNGEPRQDSNTALFLSTIEDIVVELSQGMTLQAGTIIATGTPAGVGMGFTPPRFLKIGDVVRCEIEGIGALENTVVAKSLFDRRG